MQRLSAFVYIKNNKRRIGVLIVSLMLCFVMLYLTQFILSATSESFKSILIESPLKYQYINLTGSAFGLDRNQANYESQYKYKNNEFLERIKKQEGVQDAFPVQYIFNKLVALVGQHSYYIPCVEASQVNVILDHMGASLKEGRIPEKPGEIILDEMSMKNGDYTLGDHIFTEDFVIVGVAKSDMYFGCGVRVEKEGYGEMNLILSDGRIEDLSMIVREMGYDLNTENTFIIDYKTGVESYNKDIIDAIGNSTEYIFIGTVTILSICLIVVYTMYIRDRHQEWCLYYSIGYSSHSIYFSIIRELLFSFGMALIIGTIILLFLMPVINHHLIKSLGLIAKLFHGRTIIKILYSYVWIFALLQIPIRYSFYKISTIDAMEDDLY